MGPRFSLLVASLATTISREALASPSARLVYSRTQDAASCPDEPALRKAVAARVGYDPFFPSAKQTIVVRIDLHRGAYAARVELVDEEGVARGTRELSSTQDDCVEIFDATALAISIALDAFAPQEPPPVPRSTPTPVPVPDAPPAIEPQPPAEHTERDVPEVVPPLGPPRFFAGIDVLGSNGTAPSFAVGGAAFAGTRLRFVSVALELRADVPASGQVRGGDSVTSWLYAGSLVPCAHYSVLSLCAVGMLGSLQGSGRAVESLSKSTPFAALGGRLGGELAFSRSLGLRAHVDLLRNLAPVTLSIDDNPWAAPPLVVSAGVGLVAHFP